MPPLGVLPHHAFHVVPSLNPCKGQEGEPTSPPALCLALPADLLTRLSKGEQALADEAKEAGRLIRRFEMEAKMGPWVNWIPMSIREIIMPVR
jgi:hypothetical protein